MAATEPGFPRTSHILFISDRKSKLRFKADTGTQIRFIPPLPLNGNLNPNFVLQVANSSNIKAHGRRPFELNLGHRKVSVGSSWLPTCPVKLIYYLNELFPLKSYDLKG